MSSNIDEFNSIPEAVKSAGGTYWVCILNNYSDLNVMILKQYLKADNRLQLA
ncbi:MAG: hypothetical protein JRF56_04010 [Deltaproteobacteria bacterium]|jgi:hypothetical protein|nr:hypothetical protein [Deltaproteobacteria bacterium]